MSNFHFVSAVMIFLLFIIKTLVLTDGKVLKSFNSNSMKEGRRFPILPDDSKPAKRPDLKTETRKIAAEDEDGHRVNILHLLLKKSHLLQVIVTAKFWFVSDLAGGATVAEDQASKYILHPSTLCNGY